MTTFDDFMIEVEAEARTEGPEALAELAALRVHFARVREPSPTPLPSNPMPATPPPGVIAVDIRGSTKSR